MDLILIGFMGSGKTTISQLLAQQYQLPVCDLDAEIVAQSGHTIPELFAQGGEANFRRWETRVLKTVLAQPGILATGGGTPLAPANRELLRATGAPIVHLQANPMATLARIGDDPNRPLARQLGASGITELKAARHAAYQDCADFAVATDQGDAKSVARAIAQQLGWAARLAQ